MRFAHIRHVYHVLGVGDGRHLGYEVRDGLEGGLAVRHVVEDTPQAPHIRLPARLNPRHNNRQQITAEQLINYVAFILFYEYILLILRIYVITVLITPTLISYQSWCDK